LEIGFSDLDIIRNLVIGIWDISTVSGKENRFLLNQLELAWTLPWRNRFYLQLRADSGMNLIFGMTLTL
jgi:hypothetical protein